MIPAILTVVDAILAIALIVLLVYAVLSWLIAFDIISRRNPLVNSLWEFTQRVTDPVLRPLRRMIPPIAGVDLSVLVAGLIIIFLRALIPAVLLGH